MSAPEKYDIFPPLQEGEDAEDLKRQCAALKRHCINRDNLAINEPKMNPLTLGGCLRADDAFDVDRELSLQIDSNITMTLGEIKSAIHELIDIKEKLRWRKQGEEPAPKDEKVEVATIGMFGGTCWISGALLDIDSLKDCYWRPLDLPEDAHHA